MDRQSLQDAITPFRESMQADGADLELVSPVTPDGAVHLRLNLGPQACRDCIMPREFLVEMIESRLREVDPSVGSVFLEDPRELSL